MDDTQQLLGELEQYARGHNLTPTALADALGVPRSTLRHWFLEGRARSLPSRASLRKIRAFLGRERETARNSSARWDQIRMWWRNQHRYASYGELARDIGWNEADLARHFESGLEPPRLVVEALLDRACLGDGSGNAPIELARRGAERIRHLLIVLEDELRIFRDGSGAAREVFREELDPDDIGYIASLLTMLGDEAKFARWVRLTTNRFGGFRRKRK